MMSPEMLVKWVHLLAVLGLFGGVLVWQLGLPPASRNNPELARGISRSLNLLLAVGLLAGLALVGLVHRHYLGTPAAGHFFGVVGLKLAILVIVGGVLPMAARRAHGDTLRWVAIVLLAAAALAGLTI